MQSYIYPKWKTLKSKVKIRYYNRGEGYDNNNKGDKQQQPHQLITKKQTTTTQYIYDYYYQVDY
jgi:hypothetical protein